MNMKRVFAAICVAVMMAAACVPAFASEMAVERYGRSKLAEMENADKLLWAYDQIKAGIDSFDETIYLKNDAYAVTADEADLLIKLHDRDYPEHSYADGKDGDYVLDESGTFVESFAPLYTQTREEVEERIYNGAASDYMLINDLIFHREMNEVTSIADDLEFTKNFGKNRADYDISDEEIVLTMLTKISQPILTDCSSDTIYNKDISEIGFAKNRQYIMNLYGIEAFLVEPESGHGKTYVAAKIDGEYVYIDVCSMSGDFKQRLSATEDKNAEHLVPLPNMEGVRGQVEQNTHYVKIAAIGLGSIIVISIIGVALKKKARSE